MYYYLALMMMTLVDEQTIEINAKIIASHWEHSLASNKIKCMMKSVAIGGVMKNILLA